MPTLINLFSIATLLTLSVAGNVFVHADYASTSPQVPAWRGKAPGTQYLGPDVLWRPREWLNFHMQDDRGVGFGLDITVRDMNTYMQGPRPVMIWVVGPDATTLVREIMPDDGYVAGNEQYRDGIYDVYCDFRYREWHRLHTPGGHPPTKQRSPYLQHPEKLPFRTMHVDVPAAGKGLYRVVIVASWDHWISITPDRPIRTGIHPGPGPLYIHGSRLNEAYLYIPPAVQDIGISISEEVQPFNWRLRIEDQDGTILGETRPATFLNYILHTPARGDCIYRVRAVGKTPGACMHLHGVPFVLCPDVPTAQMIHGGLQVDTRGRQTFHACQRVLDTWADSIKPDDLHVPALDVQPDAIEHKQLRDALHQLPQLLASQDLDPASPTYGLLTAGTPPKGGINLAAIAAGTQHPANPYHANPALVRRVLLHRLHDLRKQSPHFWYEAKYDFPKTIEADENSISSACMRSGWYSLGGDSLHSLSAVHMKDVLTPALPQEVADAWHQSLRLWVGSRWLMHCGDTSNQWTYNMAAVLQIWKAIGDDEILGMLRSHSRRMTAPGMLGRLNPDATPYSHKSSVGFTRAADLAMTGAGYLADGWGFDSEYTIEQVMNMGRVWDVIHEPALIDWWDKFYYLKTHLTLPKRGVHTVNCFGETCSPTDLNFRTRYYTHKSGLPQGAIDRVIYADLWQNQGQEPKRPWPCLEDGSFTRVIDNKFYFIKTPRYYSISYGGPTLPDWAHLTIAEAKDGHCRLVGYGGPGYGGSQRKATKPGGLSAVFVPDCGPTLLGSNSDIWYSNTVWGRRSTPIREKCSSDVDPTIVSSAFADPFVTFDAAGRIYRRTARLTYAPLTVTRMLHFKDDRIIVTLQLTATADLNLTELYESIPYFADDRTLKLLDADLNIGDPLPLMGPAGDGVDVDMSPVAMRGFDLTSEAGAGSAVIFDRAYTCTQSEPLRYRSVASATRSFSLPLPHQMAAGETHTIRYVIYSHLQPVAADDLRRVAQEQSL